MSLELKIKNKHLAEEARIIRFEERKLKKQIKWAKLRQIMADPNRSLWENINHHRRWDVRNEQRATYLARAFIAGVPYKQTEQKRKPEYEVKFHTFIIPRIVSMVKKYGNQDEVANVVDTELKQTIWNWVNKD